MPKVCNTASDIFNVSPTAYPIPPFTTPTFETPRFPIITLTKAPVPFPITVLTGILRYVPTGDAI